jgi:hypothetical protein
MARKSILELIAQATAETAGTSVTLSQMALVAAIEPVRSFT